MCSYYCSSPNMIRFTEGSYQLVSEPYDSLESMEASYLDPTPVMSMGVKLSDLKKDLEHILDLALDLNKKLTSLNQPASVVADRSSSETIDVELVHPPEVTAPEASVVVRKKQLQSSKRRSLQRRRQLLRRRFRHLRRRNKFSFVFPALIIGGRRFMQRRVSKFRRQLRRCKGKVCCQIKSRGSVLAASNLKCAPQNLIFLYCSQCISSIGKVPSILCKIFLKKISNCILDSTTYKNVRNMWDPGGILAWNSVIRGYTFAGMGEEAFLLFVEMLVNGFSRNRFIFLFVVKACAKIADLRAGEQVHAALIKMGNEIDVFLCNSLVHFYCEWGDLEAAREVFDKMTERKVVSWTTLMTAYSRREQPGKAIELFERMRDSYIEMPNSMIMCSVVSACGKLGDLEAGERALRYIQELGSGFSPVLVNSLVDLLMKCGDILRAEQFFHECGNNDLVLWNAMISNYVRLSMPQKGIVVFRKMWQHDVSLDRVTLLATIFVCSQLGQSVNGKQCHCYDFRQGMTLWDSVTNSLIDMYMKCDEHKTALRIFEEMGNKNVVYWNKVLASFVRNQDLLAAYDLFNLTPEKDLFYWNPLISDLAKDSQFEEAMKLFREMQNSGVNPNKVTIGAMAMEGKGVRTFEFFNEMVKHGVTFVGFLAASSHSGFDGQGKKFFELMSSKYSISPLLEHYRCMVDLLGRTRLLEEAKTLIESMPEKPNYVIWGSLLAACSINNNLDLAVLAANTIVELAPEKAGSIEEIAWMEAKEASVLFSQLGISSPFSLGLSPRGIFCSRFLNLRSISDIGYDMDYFLIHYIIMHGWGAEIFVHSAISLFSRMIEIGLMPNEVTFLNLLCACSHAKIVEQGKFYFNLMTEKFNIRQRQEHYTCKVDFLSCAGQVDYAYWFIKNMGLTPYSSTWSALLEFVLDGGIRVVDPSIVVDMTGDEPKVITQGKLARGEVGLATRIKDRKLKSFQLGEREDHLYFWFPLLSGFAQLSFDPRPEIRKR